MTLDLYVVLPVLMGRFIPFTFIFTSYAWSSFTLLSALNNLSLDEETLLFCILSDLDYIKSGFLSISGYLSIISEYI